jgi:hypothetical protein
MRRHLVTVALLLTECAAKIKLEKAQLSGDAVTPDGNHGLYFIAKNPDAPANNPIWYVDVEPCQAPCEDEDSCKSSAWSVPSAYRQVATLTPNAGIGTWLYEEKRAHLVTVPCMALDAFFGDVHQWGIPMRGAKVFAATFKDLVETQGLGNASQGDHLLLVQGSSGSSIIVQHHLDRLLGYMGDPANVFPVGLLDSGTGNVPCAFVSPGEKQACFDLAVNGTESASAVASRRAGWELVFRDYFLTNPTMADGAGAVACMGENSDDPGVCMYLEHMLKHVATPAMNLAYKFEEHLFAQALPNLTVTSNACNEHEYCSDAEQIATWHSESVLNSGIDVPGKALFLADCWTHSGAKYKSTFYGMSAGGTIEKDAIEQFVWRGHAAWTKGVAKDPTLEYLLFHDDPECDGFSCGACAADCGGAKAACMSQTVQNRKRTSFWSLAPDGPIEVARERADR